MKMVTHNTEGMEEQLSAVAQFANDLAALGIAQSDVVSATGFYVAALCKPSPATWGRLYRHTFYTLERWPGVPRDSAAAQRLFALIDDDFGRRVATPGVRARLREMLLRNGIAS